MNIYQENGYKNRDDYLDSLIGNYGVEPCLISAAAEMLDPGEDFDGLILSLEDLL